MITAHVEYLGFKSGVTNREYRLLVRHPDGHADEFTLDIAQEAFLSRRVRYQDAAEICFMKLRKVMDAWQLAPDAKPPATRQTVTEADLQEYRDAHAPKVSRRAAPPSPPAAS
jgi:hypothetical protein